jgi:hypothetical protein
MSLGPSSSTNPLSPVPQLPIPNPNPIPFQPNSPRPQSPNSPFSNAEWLTLIPINEIGVDVTNPLSYHEEERDQHGLFPK